MTPEIDIPEFIEQEHYESGFKSHYDKNIRPVLLEIEESRKKNYQDYSKRMTWATPACVITFFIFLYLSALSENGDTLGAALVVIGGILTWARGPIRKYKTEVKTLVMPSICDFYGSLEYSDKGDPNADGILTWEVFPTYTKKSSEDFIYGKYKNTHLKIFELHLQKKQQKSYATVFKGLVVSVDFPKEFKGKTVLKRDQGKLMNWFNGIGGLERIELEDAEFEDMFEVYGSDQVEARYLLTTAFMERLLQMSAARGGNNIVKPIQAQFWLNRLVILISSTQNYFEPRSIKKSALDLEDIHDFLAEMNEIFLLIDDLLEKKYGGKYEKTKPITSQTSTSSGQTTSLFPGASSLGL